MQSRIVASWVARISRMKSCTSSFERGSRPVVGSSSRSRIGCVRSARASATFCCIPRERSSIASFRPGGREADALEDPRDLVTGLAGREPVEPGRVGQVLGRRHLLEERGLDRDAVDEPANGARVGDVVPEDGCAAAVEQEQRREQPDQRRLARPVLAEDGDALAAGDLEADPAQRVDALAFAAQAGATSVAAAELLAQVLDFYCGHVLLQTRFAGTRNEAHQRFRQPVRTETCSTEAQHCGDHVTCGPGRKQGSRYRCRPRLTTSETRALSGLRAPALGL